MAGSLRMRVFAGPNGSGKSTMYRQVRDDRSIGRALDLGIYVNPDDIAAELRESGEIDLLRSFKVRSDRAHWRGFVRRSGLLRDGFDLATFRAAHRIKGSRLQLTKPELANEFAQLITAYLCELLIKRRKKFSFETVFSHPSKLALMEHAKARGFKVYLYFIATNSPEINKDRVQVRVEQGGHDVPADRIEKRYGLALQQLLPALDLCYHGFVFDNTGAEPVMFAEVKETSFGKQWAWNTKSIPDWFIKSYLLASGNPLFADVARIALEERKAQ